VITSPTIRGKKRNIRFYDICGTAAVLRQFKFFLRILTMFLILANKKMNNSHLNAFALATPNTGELAQIFGAFKALSDISGITYDNNHLFLLPKGTDNISAVKDTIAYSKYASYEDFRRDIFEMLDIFFQNTPVVPGIFILAYNQSDNKQAESNVDMTCRAVKEYYQEHRLGQIFTTVLTSRLHKYKYVDLINVPKHLLTFNSRIRLLKNQELKKKTLVTVGTINNFTRHNVNEKKQELLQKIKMLENDTLLEPIITKLKNFINTPKKIVICLGGRVEGPEIIFDINYAKKLYADADKLAQTGYGIVIVNGPRTPNNVTDFLYERTSSNPHILFQNSKRIAEDKEDRSPLRWRIYSGKNEEIFRKLQKLGNIYPGILGFDNTLAVHTMDSFSSCETANAAIPTAISSKGLYIDPSVRYDCLNLKELLCPKYAVDWDEFAHFARNMKIEPKDLNPLVLSSPLRVFAETVLNKINLASQKYK